MRKSLIGALAMGLAAASGMAVGGGRIQAVTEAMPREMPSPSRGKGKSRSHDGGGTRAYQRAALKKRNQAKHRKACRA